jgi:hypothetical protein
MKKKPRKPKRAREEEEPAVVVAEEPEPEVAHEEPQVIPSAEEPCNSQVPIIDIIGLNCMFEIINDIINR